jgi:O-antigen/teichoic acid export membrane protein
MVGLVIVLRMGIVGWLLSSLVAAVVQLAMGLRILRHRWSRSFDRALLIGALGFGLPLVPHALSHWALALSDRTVLGAYVSASQIGIYNLAYQLAVPIGVLAVAMNQGIMPIYAEATHDEVRRRELGGLASRQVVLTCLLGVAAALLGPPTIRLLMPPSYAGSADLPDRRRGTFFGLYHPHERRGRDGWQDALGLTGTPAGVVNIGSLASVPILERSPLR